VLRQLLLGLTVINLFNYVFHALLILYVTTIPVSEGNLANQEPTPGSRGG
jgi:hypothetical protein